MDDGALNKDKYRLLLERVARSQLTPAEFCKLAKAQGIGGIGRTRGARRLFGLGIRDAKQADADGCGDPWTDEAIEELESVLKSIEPTEDR
ncbi:MAG: hypothetical protein AAGK04_08100 [Planctomycetota bacterium]